MPHRTNCVRRRHLLAGSAAVTAALIAALPASAMNETRRQTQSKTIDAAFNLTGNGINIGQNERTGVPIAHTAVPFTQRGGDGTALHALEVAGIMVSIDGTYSGMAPQANLFSDEPSNDGVAAGTIPNAGSAIENNFLDSISWLRAAPRSTLVINYSDFLPTGGANPATPGSKASLGLDWWVSLPRASGGDFLFTKSAGNGGTSPVTEPGASFNIMTVGAVTNQDYQDGTTFAQGPVDHRWNVVANFSNFGGAAGVSKPDIVAPGGRIDTDGGEVGFTMASNTPPNSFSSSAGGDFVGTSFAAPHVAGIAAQLYQLAPNTDHRAMKAVLMNSADHTVRGIQHEAAGGAHGVFYRQLDSPWTAGAHGLDATSGAGMVDAWEAAINLMGSGDGRIAVSTGSLANNAPASNVYNFTVGVDTRVVATVVWDRAVTRTESPDPVARPQDYTFAANAAQPHFALSVNGPVNVTQATVGGSVQHINTILSTPGNYSIRVQNDSGAAGAGGNYAIAFAVSPPDVNPGIQNAYFTVRDQIHRPRAERTPATGVPDRIYEGRTGSDVRLNSVGDANLAATSVEATVYKTTMNGSNSNYQTGTQLGLMEVAGADPDDHVNDISFGRDDIRDLRIDGGRVWFSVDAFAHGLSPVGVDNPETGVFSEASIVHEAAGDVFRSNMLLPGAGPITNQNRKVKNGPDTDFLHPANNLNNNTTYADSYYLGLVGARVADHEDDLTGLEGLGSTIFNPNVPALSGDFVFFTLDRGSPSTTGAAPARRTGNIYVHKVGTNQTRLYASAAQLGLRDEDTIDGLMVEHLSGLGADGFPVYSPLSDFIIFSVDRDSRGLAGSAVAIESLEGEMPGDLFYANATAGNSLFLEATDLGLQEFDFGDNYNWLSDNLDAIDIPDLVPEPTAAAVLLMLCGLVGFGRRDRHRVDAAVPVGLACCIRRRRRR